MLDLLAAVFGRRRPSSVVACVRRAAPHQIVGSGPGAVLGPADVPETASRRSVSVELDPTPRPVYCDPYAGVVNGPQLVDRTRWCHDWHVARWSDDDGFLLVDWGRFEIEMGDER